MDNVITKLSVNDIIYEISGTDTSDATATQNDILSGKTAYVNGSKIEGTIPPYQTSFITPGIDEKTIPGGVYIPSVVTVTGDSNLLPENIREGISIFGVSGTSKYSGTCLAPTYQVACSLGPYQNSNGYLTFNPHAFVSNGSFKIEGNKLICLSNGNYTVDTKVYKTNNWSFAYGLDMYINGMKKYSDPLGSFTADLSTNEYIQLYHRVQTDENGTWASVSAVVIITKN